MSSFTRTLFIGAAAIAFHAPAFAATAVPMVVVTATRSPVPIHQIASSMTVITSEEIDQKNKPEVIELLREVPGVVIANNGGRGQTSRVFLRGTNSNHVLVILDGVIVNDPSDPGEAFDFSNLAPDNIERIEILRGPQSTLYGSKAIGGVINIITKEGKGAPKYNAFAEYGRYNTSRAGVGTSGEAGKISYSLQASNLHSDGISSFDKKFGGYEKDGSNSYNFSANIVGKLSDRFTVRFSSRYNRNNTQFDSPGGFLRPADDPFPDNDSRQYNGRLAGELSLFDGRWTQELGVTYLNLNRNQITEYFDSIGNPFFGRQQQYGSRETVDWLHRIKIMQDHLLTVGLEAYSDHFKTANTSEVNVDNQAVFADDQFSAGDFFMNVGARIDNHQSFGKEFTWKVAPGYRIAATGTTLKTTYGTGFKAPSLSQLFDPGFGNNNLQPEKSKGYDIGFEQSLWGDKLTFGSTAFRNNIRQLIGFDNAPPFAAINVGRARTRGVETVMTLRPTVDWTITASHVYTYTEDRSRDRELARRPKHQANLGVMYQYTQDWDMGVNARYSSSRQDIDINFPFGRVVVKPFTVVDLSTNYKINPNATVYARLDNALDERYEEVFAYGQPGRSLFAGIKLNY